VNLGGAKQQKEKKEEKEGEFGEEAGEKKKKRGTKEKKTKGPRARCIGEPLRTRHGRKKTTQPKDRGAPWKKREG